LKQEKLMNFPKEIYVRHESDGDVKYLVPELTPDDHAVVGEKVSVARYVRTGVGVVATGVRFDVLKQ
jgi:hypothetical protein